MVGEENAIFNGMIMTYNDYYLDIALSSHIWDGHPQYYFRDGLKPPIVARSRSIRSRLLSTKRAKFVPPSGGCNLPISWRILRLLRLGLGV